MAASISHPTPARVAAEQRLSALRGKLRDLYAARKERMKAFVAECRAERKALGEEIGALKKRSLDHLREHVTAARGAANLVRLTRLAEIRQTFGADLRGARAALAVEKQHQVELARIAREEAERRREIQHAHDLAVKAEGVRSVLLGKLGPFFAKEGRAVVHVPGQPRAVALLHHAERHAPKAQAVVDPEGARKLEETERAVAHAETHVRSVGGNVYVLPAKPAVRKGVEETEAPVGKAANVPSGKRAGDPPRAKGQLPRGGGPGISLAELLGERDELAKRTTGRETAPAKSFPPAPRLPWKPAANANARPVAGPAKSPQRAEENVKAPELRDTADIAKRIRADIGDAVRRTELPKATYTVRTSKYSMGSSINIEASKLPFPVLNPDAFVFNPHYQEVTLDRSKFKSQYTPAAEAVLTKLNALVDAYHWDRSDSASDYYNERFSRDVKLDSSAEWPRIKAIKSGAEAPKSVPPSAPTRAVPAKRASKAASTEAPAKKTAAAKKPLAKKTAPAKKTAAAKKTAPAKKTASTKKPLTKKAPSAKQTPPVTRTASKARPPSAAIHAVPAPAAPTPKKSGTRRRKARAAVPKGQQSLDTDSPLFAGAPRFQAPAAPPRAPNAYEAKKAARIERLHGRATKARAGAERAFVHRKQISDRIPLGQPILVGHSSEGRHRRDVARIAALVGKGVALSKEADALSRRADSAQKNRAVSSDDPDAVPKLRAKLEALEEDRKRMVRANVVLLKGEEVSVRLGALGFTAQQASALQKKDELGRVGFPPYTLANAAAEERRLRERIAQLEAKKGAPARADETVGGAVISEADNRVRIMFPSKPPEALRGALKSAGFRWAPSANAWQRMASRGAWSEARRILGEPISPSTSRPHPKA